MACLSKNGQELARMYIKATNEDRDTSIIWASWEYALMSNNRILSKHIVMFRPTAYDTQGRRHTWGWKVHGRLQTGLDVNDFVRTYEKRGFTKTK